MLAALGAVLAAQGWCFDELSGSPRKSQSSAAGHDVSPHGVLVCFSCLHKEDEEGEGEGTLANGPKLRALFVWCQHLRMFRFPRFLCIWEWDGAVHMMIISVIVSSDFRGNQGSHAC